MEIEYVGMACVGMAYDETSCHQSMEMVCVGAVCEDDVVCGGMGWHMWGWAGI